MDSTWSTLLHDECATQHCATALAHALSSGVVYLVGDLGAGKTTLTRYWLQALGHQGNVKSPTYTLIEPYQLAHPIYHFDLYRLDDPYELELMGMRDYLEDPAALLLIEWPQKGQPIIPLADWHIQLTTCADQSRQLRIDAPTLQGQQALRTLMHH
jgi:tRNA threonylcarbamoyladenosine biosynthesis protein TsaE